MQKESLSECLDTTLATKVPITGLGGLLFLAKDKGIIHSLKAVLDDLIQYSYHLSDSICCEIIRCSGE